MSGLLFAGRSAGNFRQPHGNAAYGLRVPRRLRSRLHAGPLPSGRRRVFAGNRAVTGLRPRLLRRADAGNPRRTPRHDCVDAELGDSRLSDARRPLFRGNDDSERAFHTRRSTDTESRAGVGALPRESRDLPRYSLDGGNQSGRRAGPRTGYDGIRRADIRERIPRFQSPRGEGRRTGDSRTVYAGRRRDYA